MYTKGVWKMEVIKEKKNFDKRKIIVITLIVVALIIACVLIIRNLGEKEQKSIFCLYDEEQDITAVYIDEKKIGTIEGQFSSLDRNMNDTGVYLTDDESTLYCIGKNKINRIGENLSLVTIANFSKEALVLDDEENLYRCNGKKIEKITDKNIEFAAISGDGKTYSYYSEGTSYMGKKPGKETMVEDVVITYISKNAKTIYALSLDASVDENLWEKMYYYYCFYSKTSFDLYSVDKNGDKTLIKEDLSTIDGLNADGTEIMFSTDTETYVSVDGGKATKVSDYIVQSINYENSENISYGHFNKVDSFKDTICIAYDEDMNSYACLISSGYKAEIIVHNCSTILDVDGELKEIIYLDDEASMYYAEVEKDAKEELISESVIDGKMSSDGEHIYYVNIGDGMELHYLDDDLKDTKVTEFEDYWSITVVGDVCYLETDETFYVKNEDYNKIDEEGHLFFDSVTQNVYWNSYTSVSKLDGKDFVKLKGEYKSISSYEVAN